MIPMNPLIRAHLAHLRRMNARAATIRDRRNNLLRVATWLAAHFDGVTLEHVTYAQLLAWQDSLTVCVSSQRTYLAHVKAFFGWAHEYDLLELDPSAKLIRPKLPRRLPRFVGDDEYVTALRTARGDLVGMLLLAGYLGLRVGEISRLCREDVLRERAGTFLRVKGKGGKERLTPVPPQLAIALRPWTTGRTGPLFLNPAGRQVPPDYVTRQISGHFQALGMAHTAHKCRHGAARRLMQLTRQNIVLTKHVLGHESLTTTTIYLDITDEEAMTAITALDAQLAVDLAVERGPDDDGDDDGMALCAA